MNIEQANRKFEQAYSTTQRRINSRYDAAVRSAEQTRNRKQSFVEETDSCCGGHRPTADRHERVSASNAANFASSLSGHSTQVAEAASAKEQSLATLEAIRSAYLRSNSVAALSAALSEMEAL